MAAFDVFNPDVPDIKPGDYDVTRPISRPEANTAKGKLFEAAGTALKDTGQLVTDATKLQDFTNKEFLSNAISEEAGLLRSKRTLELEQQNIALVNTPPPNVVTSISGKVDKLKAMADQTQQDAYFRAKVADLAKEYRSSYPQFRDFIDRQFEKAGFGNPANEYMSSLEKANQKIQATLSVGNDKLINEIYTHLDKTGPEGSQMIDALQKGADPSAIRSRFSQILNNKFKIDERVRQLGLAKAQGENFETAATRHVIDSATGDLATYMQNPQVRKDLAYLDNASKGGPSDEQELQNIKVRLSQGLVSLTGGAQERDSNPIHEMSIDENGNEFATGKQFTPTGALKEKYASAIGAAFKPLSDIINNLEGGPNPLIKHTANMTAARVDETASQLMSPGGFDRAFATAAAIRQFAPEWLTQMMQANVLTGMKFGGNTFSKQMEGFIAGTNFNSMGGNPPPVARTIQNILDAGMNNPSIVKPIVDFGPRVMADSTAPKEVLSNVTQAYTPPGASPTDNMSPKDKTEYFLKMTKPSVVQNIGKLGPQEIGMYGNWVLSEFSKNVGADLGNLPTIAEKYKVVWNDTTHQFKAVFPEDKPFQRTPQHYVHLIPIEATVDRINANLSGLANYAKASGIEGAGVDVNSYLINIMKQKGLTDSKFWDAVKAQEGSRIVPTKEAPKEKKET